MKLLHQEVADCVSCPAYSFHTEKPGDCPVHTCNMGATKLYYGQHDARTYKPALPGFIAQDCPLPAVSQKRERESEKEDSDGLPCVQCGRRTYGCLGKGETRIPTCFDCYLEDSLLNWLKRNNPESLNDPQKGP